MLIYIAGRPRIMTCGATTSSASHLAGPAHLRAGETGRLRRTSSTTGETHLSAECRRRSRSPYFAPATRVPRLPMRFRLRRASRRSRWFAAAVLSQRLAHRGCAKCGHRPDIWDGGGRRLLARTIASDATYSVAGNRIASWGTAASWAKRLALRMRPEGDRCGFPHCRAGSQKQASSAAIRVSTPSPR
jgi:hypothetical protein